MGRKTIRAVVAGCGGISNAWLEPAKKIEGLQIVGLVDLREDAARAMAAKHGLPEARIGTDLAEVLRQTTPDAVFDCTVPEAHVKVVLTALKHGCHVLGEKPMADTMPNARKMAEAARKAGRTYAVIQNRRYLPDIRRLRRFLASGAIGKVTMLQSDFFIGAHFGGFRDVMQHVLLLDMAIHTFDAARYIAGADAQAVYCREWNPAGSWYKHGASAVALFEMSEGITYVYGGSWCAEGCNTSWECSWRIQGEKGTVLWDGGQQFRAQRAKPKGKPGFFSEMQDLVLPAHDARDRVGGHEGLLREFVDCLRSGRTPETVCADNIRSLAMVHAAIASAKSGKRTAVKG